QDPRERSRRGRAEQEAVLARETGEPATLLETSWRDFVYAEIWRRPGLDRRARYLVAIAGASCAGGPAHVIDGYVRGALVNRGLTPVELSEGALQVAVYGGWSAGVLLDESVTRMLGALELPAPGFAPLRAEPRELAVRIAEARAVFERVARTP